MNDKKQLREKLKTLRSRLSEQEIRLGSQVITEKLLNMLDWQAIKTMHIYDSVADWKEVDTTLLIATLKENYPRISMTTPGLKKNQEIPSKKFDVIIAPVLGFDHDNHRLGLGGGWYDKFLAKQKGALKIGLAWQMCFIQNLPHEAHDIALDKIITEV